MEPLSGELPPLADFCHPLLLLDMDLRVRFANPCFAAGFPGGAAVGAPVFTIPHSPWHEPDFEPWLRQAVRAPDTLDGYESAVALPGGGRRTWVVRACPVPGHGGPPGVIVVAEDVTGERQRLERERWLALAGAQQRERERLAQRLHDHLQQLLVGAQLQLALLGGGLTDPAHVDRLGQVSKLLDESIQCSRDLTSELSPQVLFESGLVAAFGWLAEWMADKQKLRVTVRASAVAEPESRDLRVILFESVRELLFNVVKHAGVGRADLEVTEPDPGRLRCLVRDAGRGFDPGGLAASERGDGFGLPHVRRRIEGVGGRFELESGPGRGATVTLTVPRS